MSKVDNDEYGISEQDLEGGGGSSAAKPRGKYTGSISQAEVKPDKNGKLYLKFGISITKGPYKGQLIFENYLPLSKNSNKFQLARRNSLFQALGLDAGSIPPGAPGGPKPSVINGAIVDINLEHEFEDVPGEQYSLDTSKSKKSRWVSEGWEENLDSSGRLVKNFDGDTFDPIEPRETLTFYGVSDDFDGLPALEDDGFTPDESASDEDWG